MREKGKKCICKHCEDCAQYRDWILTNDKGEQKHEKKCGLFVLYDEISRIRGAIQGCQQASEEARNRVMEYGAASVHTLQLMQQALPEYMEEINKKLIEAGNA